MSIRISNLLDWNNQAARAMNSTPFWMELVRTFGTELLYFLIDKAITCNVKIDQLLVFNDSDYRSFMSLSMRYYVKI